MSYLIDINKNKIKNKYNKVCVIFTYNIKYIKTLSLNALTYLLNPYTYSLYIKYFICYVNIPLFQANSLIKSIYPSLHIAYKS